MLLGRSVVLLLLSLCLVSGVSAQDSADLAPDPTARDPQALAERYLGFTGDLPIPPLTPTYQPGDSAQFWVGKVDSPVPVRIGATLAAAAPNIYLWVEDGITPNGNLAQTALQLNQIVTIYRTQDNYRQAVDAPGIGTLSDSSDLLPIPDVDNDPHLFVLYATNLREDREAILNPLDSQPVEYAPYSNLHEMLYVNTSSSPGTPLSDPLYTSMQVRALYRWIINTNVPHQAAWLTEALNWYLFLTIQQQQIGADNLSAYLQTPDTSLTQLSTPTTLSASLGAQQLFLAYLLQRYGSPQFTDLFLQSGSGLSALDAVLKQHSITDPVTGAPISGRDAFADFVMTNGLDLAFGDGRYMQNTIQLPNGQVAAATTIDPTKELPAASVNQFGAQYFSYMNETSEAATVKMAFTGSPTVARLPMPDDRDPADQFYWSGRGGDHDTTLTRSVDLSAVSRATLTFDAWYSLASDWNYGYVSVSSDDGTTWKPLSATTSSTTNLYGTEYGAGFTGVSNAVKPHPFPTIGVIIEGDGVTVSDVVPGGAGAQAGIRKGDMIVGYDNQEWTVMPNIIGLLANYLPGDTLHLYVQRSGQRSDVPVLLGAHPTRVVEPPPLWLAQSVDLTPYAGQEILLRFESISLPGHEDQGFAVDHLAIPEIKWTDDGDGDLSASGWMLNGWQQIDNQVAQHWIVQSGTSGTQTSIPRVLTLLKSSPDERADVVSNGEWRFSLAPGETITFAVSGVNDDTLQRATFSLAFKN